MTCYNTSIVYNNMVCFRLQSSEMYLKLNVLEFSYEN